ncbi:MAG: hypothetical protein ACR2MY_11770 [Candidatus Dormibacteria bacterium]
MGFVVIRRFRTGEGPASSRVYADERHARDVARTWANEGWEVEVIASGQRTARTVKVAVPPPMPEKRFPV